MLKPLLFRIRLLLYAVSSNRRLERLKYWWLTQEKHYLIPVATLGIFPAVLGIAIWQLMGVQEQTVETQRQNGEMHCLALNVYHEARGEPKAGQYAVAEVTMNRVSSERYPNTVCDVVYEKRWDRIRKRYVGAFSWTELEVQPASNDKAWEQAREVAENVYYQREIPKLDGALFYHARRVKPSWARKKVLVARIGRHIFYK